MKNKKDMDFEPKVKDIIEMNIEEKYVIFKQHRKTKFAIKSGKINFNGKTFGFNCILK